MITPDTIKAALGDDPTRYGVIAGEWLCNGDFAAHVPDPAGYGGTREFSADAADGIAGLLRQQRVPVAEDVAMRIPDAWQYKDEYEDTCDGCDCGECPGKSGAYLGKRRRLMRRGQAVFRGAHGRNIVQPLYRALLDGYSVEMISDGKGAGTFVGLDESGCVTVLVMMMRGEPRDPAMEQRP